MTLVADLQAIVDALDSRLKTGKITLEVLSEREFTLVPTVPDAFPISIRWNASNDIEVALEPWHEHMTSVQLAIHLSTWLLTPYYRVVTPYHSGEAIETYTEAYRDEGWEFMLEVSLMNPENGLPEPDEIRIRQHAIFLDSNFLKYFPKAQLDAAGYPVGTLLGETIYHLRNGEWHPTNVPDLPQD